MKEFKKLLGNRVYLEIPKQKESPIIIDENTKTARDKAFFIEMRKVKVYAVGDLVTSVKPGDIVLVNPAHLQAGLIVELSKELSVLLISPFDIIMVW